MIINKRIIHRMTIKEKLRFIISNDFYKSNSLNDYEFPVLKFKDSFTFGRGDNLTCFPSFYQMTYTWNPSLINKVASAKTQEMNHYGSFNVFKLDSSMIENKVESYLNVKMASSFLKGVSTVTGVPSAIDFIRFNENEKKYKEVDALAFNSLVASNRGDIEYIIVNSVDELKDARSTLSYNKKILAKNNSFDEITKLIYNRVPLIFSSVDKEVIINNLEPRFELEQQALLELSNKEIDHQTLQVRYQVGEIASIDALDSAVDDLINILREETALNDEKENARRSLQVDCDLEENSDLAYQASLESIVLLRNRENILPLKPDDLKIGIIGEVVSNEELYLNEFKCKPTSFERIYNLLSINGSTINSSVERYPVVAESISINSFNLVGFAQGYDIQNRSSYNPNRTKELIAQSQVLVMFLYANDEESIPDYQLDLVRQVKAENKKIIVVLKSNKQVDLSPLSEVDAILYLSSFSQESNQAILDILLGNANPSGKLPFEYISDGKIKYHIGHGLSYTKFELSELRVTDNGVSCLVKNVGEMEGQCVVQMYVTNVNSDSSLNAKLLKGFSKVFLNPGEVDRINIEFDANTFKYYNTQKGLYGVEKGTYLISVGTSYHTPLEREIKLSSSYDSEFYYENIKVKDLNENATVDELIENAPVKKLYRLNLFVTLLIMVYFLGVAGYLSYFNYTKGKNNLILYIVAGAIGGLALLIGLIHICRLEKSDKEVYRNPNESLSKMIDSSDEFNIVERIGHIEFEEEETQINDEEDVQVVEEKVEPVVEETPIEEEEDIVQGELEEEETPVTQFDVDNVYLSENEIKAFEEEERIKLLEAMNKDDLESEFEPVEDNVVFDNTSTLNKIVSNFITFAKAKGIIVELSSARSLFSALASSKMIFLKSDMKDLLPELVNVLNEYLGNKNKIIEASDNWVSDFNLSWRKYEDTYIKTDFVNDLYRASLLKNNINTLLLSNVNLDNIHAYLNQFIKFSLNPNKDVVFTINNKTGILIPKNLCVIIIPSSNSQLDKLDRDLSTCSMTVDLILRRKEPTVLEEEINALSYSYFVDLIDEAKLTYFIKEKVWKKIDEFESGLNKLEPFTIGNKSVIAIENYSSTFLASGGDNSDLIGHVLTSKLIPLVKSMNVYKENSDTSVIEGVIASSFGNETLSSVKSSLISEGGK